MKCEICNTEMIWEEDKVYLSNPPMYGYKCPKCGNIQYSLIPNLKEKQTMTQEERDLLLKDLCSRLPYGVWMKSGKNDFFFSTDSSDKRIGYFIKTLYAKPYLRTMSSMTEEERKYANEHFFSKSDNFVIDDVGEMYVCPQPYETVYTLSLVYQSKYFDWLNANHFDYRGLIPMGLALPAKEGMYDTK